MTTLPTADCNQPSQQRQQQLRTIIRILGKENFRLPTNRAPNDGQTVIGTRKQDIELQKRTVLRQRNQSGFSHNADESSIDIDIMFLCSSRIGEQLVEELCEDVGLCIGDLSGWTGLIADNLSGESGGWRSVTVGVDSVGGLLTACHGIHSF